MYHNSYEVDTHLYLFQKEKSSVVFSFALLFFSFIHTTGQPDTSTSSTALMDSQRQLGALLTLVVKSLFEEVPVDAATLKQEIYADIEAATPEGWLYCKHLQGNPTRKYTLLTSALAIQTLFETSRSLISQGAANDLEVTQFEALVKKQPALSPVQQDLLVKFWKNQKQEIHNNIYRSVSWNNSLQKIAWRIDMKSKTKGGGDLNNEPTAIVELSIGRPKQAPEAQKLVRFEMDRTNLARVLLQINNIKQQIATRAATQ